MCISSRFLAEDEWKLVPCMMECEGIGVNSWVSEKKYIEIMWTLPTLQLITTKLRYVDTFNGLTAG